MNFLKNFLCLLLLTAGSDGVMAPLQSRSCNHDNCLNALLKASGANAASFCRAASIGSLTGVTENLNTECTGSIERALSACACIASSTTSRTIQISSSTTSVLSSSTSRSSSSVIKTSGLSSSLRSRSSSSSLGKTSPSSSRGPSATNKISVSSSSSMEKTTSIFSPRSSSSTVKVSTISLQKTTSISPTTASLSKVGTPISSSISKSVSSSFVKPATSSLTLSSSTNTKAATQSQTQSSSSLRISSSVSSTTSSSSIGVTSSATLSSTTIDITGVEFNLITSPHSCYTLPIPTTEAVSLPWDDTINTTIGEPVDIYFLESIIVPGFTRSLESISEYGVNYNGSYIMLDASSSSYWGFVSNAGQALVINDTGVFLFTKDCSLVLTATIPNFASQLETIANSSNDTNQKRKRSNPTLNDLNAFDVMVTLYNQCGEPASNANPQVVVQATPCNLIAELIDGTWLFGCTFNGLAYCENDMQNRLNFLTYGWPKNIPDAWDSGKSIADIVKNTVKSGWKIFNTLGDLTEDVFLDSAMEILGNVQDAVEAEGAAAVAARLCSDWQTFVNIVNQYTDYAEVNCDTHLGFLSVTDLTAVPTTTSTILFTATVTDPSTTCTACPTPLTLCGSDCVDTTSDILNCGACGHVCDCACVFPPDVCTDSQCVAGSFR